MSEQYLPVRESLGYKNVKKVFWDVMGVDLDDINIHEGEDENFNFLFEYNSYEVMIGISSIGKNVQFEVGEGGLFNIWFRRFHGEQLVITFLNQMISSIEEKEKIKRIFGKDRKAIEYALRILKDILDSEEAGKLLKRLNK